MILGHIFNKVLCAKPTSSCGSASSKATKKVIVYAKRQKFIGNVLQLFLHDGKQKGSVIKNRPDYFFQSFI